MLTFDQFLSDRIKFGKYQITQFLVLSIIAFQSGFQMVFLTILIPVLELEWNLTNQEVILMGMLYFLGNTLGLIFQGFFSDILGRKKLLCLSVTISLICIFLHIYLESIFACLIVRFIFGLTFGIEFTITQILNVEISPLNIRGRMGVSLLVFFLFGIYYLLIGMMIFFDTINSGNWRALFIMYSIPVTISLITSLTMLEESARFNLAKNKYSLCFKKLNLMGFSNQQNYQPLTFSEKDELIKWQLELYKLNSKSNFKDLFRGSMKFTTLNLWAIAFLWYFQLISTNILQPFVFSDADRSIKQYFIVHLVEFPATIVAFLLIDTKKYGGRKNSLMLSLVLYAICEICLYYFEEKFLFFGMMAIKFIEKICWISFSQLRIETYLTLLRSIGVGIADGVGRIGTIVSPLIIMPIYKSNTYLPFLVMAIFSLANVVFVWMHPVELTSKPLDDINRKIHN